MKKAILVKGMMSEVEQVPINTRDSQHRRKWVKCLCVLEPDFDQTKVFAQTFRTGF